MAFCSNCGNELKDGVKFCPKCGTKTNVAPAPVEYSSDDEEEEYEELGIGWKILIFLIFPVGFGVYNSNWENQPYKAHSAIVWTIWGWLASLALQLYFYYTQTNHTYYYY